MSLGYFGGSGFENFIENVGSRALQVLFILSILLAIVVGSMIATGIGDEYTSGFVDRLSDLLNIRWMYNGMMMLARGIDSLSRALQFFDPYSLFVGLAQIAGGMITVIVSIIGIVLTGYISISMFIIDMLPGIIKPLGIFVAISLIFVQLCVFWVLARYIYNLVKSLLETLIGGR